MSSVLVLASNGKAHIPVRIKKSLCAFLRLYVFIFYIRQRSFNFCQARKRHPYLRRFENSWATDALCHQYFKNHRRHILKRVRRVGDSPDVEDNGDVLGENSNGYVVRMDLDFSHSSLINDYYQKLNLTDYSWFRNIGELAVLLFCRAEVMLVILKASSCKS